MNAKVKVKALALLSGGLDSTLALKLILAQGIDRDIEVVAANFVLPFISEKRNYARDVAARFRIPHITIEAGEEYIKMIRNPKHGYGSGMNPCIDCRIFMLREAKKIANEIGANFIFTGEVLGERPMSQNRKALELVEKETGLENLVLRPLSAKLLPETIPEKEGWVDRSKFLSIKGRSRKTQIALAKKFGIEDYPSPAGGCLLTNKEFAAKIRDLFEHKKMVSMKDVRLLKIGRHFRFGERKIIVGRNEEENEHLLVLKNPEDYIFEVPDCGSPITILEGSKEKKKKKKKKKEEAIEIAAKLTARYSDAEGKEILVKYGEEKQTESIIVSPLNENEIARLRI